MRTDRFFLTASALTGALLVMPGGPVAAQDTLQASAAEAAAPAARTRSDIMTAGRDVHVGRGEVVDGKIVLARGDLVVEGHVTGDVTVTGGDLRVMEGGTVDGSVNVTGGDLSNAGLIGGDAEVVGGRLINDHGRIAGEMSVLDNPSASADADEDAPPHAMGTDVMRTRTSWMHRFGNGLSGLASTVALGLLLGGLGAGLIFFAHPQLERVSDSVRRDTLRAGALGIASHFLVVPVFVVGIVLLVLSLIGIPLLLLFLPLFWVVVAAAAACGVVAVAHALGERSAERSGSFEPRHRNSYTYLINGLGLMLAPLVAANLLKLTGFLYGIGTLVEVLSKMGLWAAATVGFGAVLLTRAGMGPHWSWKRRSYDPIIDGDAFGGSNA